MTGSVADGRDTRARVDDGKLADALMAATAAARAVVCSPKFPDADPRFPLPAPDVWSRLRELLHGISSPTVRHGAVLALLLEVERRDHDDRVVTMTGRVALGHHAPNVGGAS